MKLSINNLSFVRGLFFSFRKFGFFRSLESFFRRLCGFFLFRERRKFLQRFYAEAPQKCGRRAVNDGPAGEFESSLFLDEALLSEGADDAGAVDPSYLFDERLRDRLIVSDDRQDFEGGAGERRVLLHGEHRPDRFGELGAGAELDLVSQAFQDEAALAVIQLCGNYLFYEE